MSRRALVVVDVQNDFVDGSLGTARGAEVAAAISSLFASDANTYTHIVGTLDWHIDPKGHFAKVGEEPDYSETWPVHCLADSHGAQPYPALDTAPIEVWFRKGQHSAAYSGFEGITEMDLGVNAGSVHGAGTGTTVGEEAEERNEHSSEGLAEWLQDRQITHVDVVGIATDFCVKATALDAHAEGFHTKVLENLCSPVSEEGARTAIAEMQAAGVHIA